jgi:hypothetical protein
MVLRFALDQNFPTPVVEALREFIQEVELVSIRDIHPDLPRFDDWKLLLALFHEPTGWNGLVTTDAAMLRLPRELATLVQTNLTLIVAEAAGHDPLKATGLVFTHLPQICTNFVEGRSQVWLLRASARQAEKPMDYLKRIADRRNMSAKELFKKERLTKQELGQNPVGRKTRL